MDNLQEHDTMTEESERSSNNGKQVRENWSGRFDFILSCIGYAVGIGNIARFPYLCYKNGGGAFLIPYLVCMVLGALPMFFLEYAMSQFSSSSAITVWNICPLFKGVGYTTLIISIIFSTYFNIFMTWILYFLYQSLTSVLPWTDCNNEWNTDQCYDGLINKTHLNGSSDNTSTFTASEEYWRNNVLEITSGLEHMGSIQLELLLCLFLSWLLLFLCLFKSIKSSGKVVYVTVTFPYLILLILFARAVTLPGATEGIKFFIFPKWDKMLSTKVWGEAALQIFFSSGIGWGCHLTFASFNKFHHNMYRDAMIVPVVNSATSIFSGFVTFSILGFMAQKKGMSVDDVLTQGPGLVFEAYPEAIAQLPISPLWAVLFFLMMMTVAMDTQFGTVETVVTAITDEFPKYLKNKKTVLTALICVFGFIADIPFIMQGGMYVLQIVDWYCGLFSCMIVSVVECITIGWIYGIDRFARDIEMMIGFKPNVWWRVCWKFITPLMLLMMLGFNMSQISPVSYSTYQYPGWAIGIGWVIGLISLVPIPLCSVYYLWKVKDSSILQKIKDTLKPTQEWGPASIESKNKYIKSLIGSEPLSLIVSKCTKEKQNML